MPQANNRGDFPTLIYTIYFNIIYATLCTLVASMVDVTLMSSQEIAAELGSRLRAHRLQLRVTQQELAARAGVNVNTVKNLEMRPGSSSLETMIRVAQALGLSEPFESLFVVIPRSIAQMAIQAQAPRQRARRKRSP